MITDDYLNKAASCGAGKSVYLSTLLGYGKAAALHRENKSPHEVQEALNLALYGVLYQAIQTYMAVSYVIDGTSHETSLVRVQKAIDEIFTPARLTIMAEDAKDAF